MNKMDRFLLNAKTKAQMALEKMSAKATGDETLIIKIMLMVVAVVLVIAFRDSLKTVIENLLTTVSTKIEAMYSNTP